MAVDAIVNAANVRLGGESLILITTSAQHCGQVEAAVSPLPLQ
jgi:hypothetical protein